MRRKAAFNTLLLFQRRRLRRVRKDGDRTHEHAGKVRHHSCLCIRLQTRPLGHRFAEGDLQAGEPTPRPCHRPKAVLWVQNARGDRGTYSRTGKDTAVGHCDLDTFTVTKKLAKAAKKYKVEPLGLILKVTPCIF